MKSLFLFSIVLASVNSALSQCGVGWGNPFEGSCYHIARDPETWIEAMKFCQLEGGTLAQIETAMEQHEITQMINDPDWDVVDEFWIGGTDWAKEGVWIWEPSKVNVTYTNWVPGDPDNGGQVEHCMCIDRREQYRWRDEYCSDKLVYICEKPVPQQPIIVG